MALEDLHYQVVPEYDSLDVAVVGIPVHLSSNSARRIVSQAKAQFPQLMDPSGNAMAEVGNTAMPRIYVLDDEGKIVWFDIEYSESTRRELFLTLDALAPAEEQAAAGEAAAQ